METTAEVSCPHCGEMITLFLDLSVEEQSYIEDCSVCCRPMTVAYCASEGELTHVEVDATS
jgi:Cysteine-rich CPXCG